MAIGDRLGANIRRARESKHMTVQELSKSLYLERTTIYKYEQGIVIPTLMRLEEIHHVLGVPLWDLLPKEE